MPAIRENYVRHAAHLVQLRERTGKDIALALEPEPKCFLETIEETARYFEEELFRREGRHADRRADRA